MRDQLHREACEAGKLTYTDPETGYQAFTALGLERRGECCGCGCRHCPYGHRNVRGKRPPARDPWFENHGDESDDSSPCDVLFWSGGKDSYLALRTLQREGQRPIVLLTTFEDSSEIVAHQGIRLAKIQEQARALATPIVLVPLLAGHEYVDRLELGLRTLMRRRPIARLAFGDLHLEEIRGWREEALAPLAQELGVRLTFPLWQRPYPQLAAELAEAPATCRVSSVDESLGETIRVGELYDASLVARLPPDVDAFGENGEFHTCIELDS